MGILGAGWINAERYGMWRSGSGGNYESFKEIRSPEKEIFTYPVKNFGRFDLPSKFACISVALALKDAGISYEQGSHMDIGLLGTNSTGAVNANAAYYKDFVECGRTLGRGNLFIYTLPSSPLAEVSIYFGIEGPLLYVANTQGDLTDPIQTCSLLVSDGQAGQMVLVKYTTEGSLCYVLDGDAQSTLEALETLKNNVGWSSRAETRRRAEKK